MTLAFVESPVQLLNVLEWAHAAALIPGAGPADTAGTAGTGSAGPAGAAESTGAVAPASGAAGPGSAVRDGAAEAEFEAEPEGAAAEGSGDERPPGRAPAPVRPDLTVVVLSPHDPMTRGQLRRVAELARDEGVDVRWEEARGGPSAPLKTVGSLVGDLRRARRVVIGDPFSRYVQLLLTLTSARSVVVVDDGTATMEFVSQLAGGERLVRWHRKGASPAGLPDAAQSLLFAPFARRARARLTPGPARGTEPADGTDRRAGRTGAVARGGRREPGARRARSVEVFSSMPVDASGSRLREMGVAVTSNDFAWTRSRFGPPRLTRGTDLVGTSLVETGVVDPERYLEGVAALARTHGATRYFAHRRESGEKLHRVQSATGLEIVRPDLPLELVARRGPIGRTVVSFPSTVVHTLPLALAGTPVSVTVCDVDRTWFTPSASPRAEGFLTGVTESARRVRRLGVTKASGAARAVTEQAAERRERPGAKLEAEPEAEPDVGPGAGGSGESGTGTRPAGGAGPGTPSEAAAETGDAAGTAPPSGVTRPRTPSQVSRPTGADRASA